MLLSSWNRFQLFFKCFISYVFLPITLILVWPFLHLIMRYRIFELAKVRQQFAELVKDKADHPVMICMNHLTRIDSMILACAVMPPWEFFFKYSYLPWHVLDFGNLPIFPTLCAVVKTIPIERMGDRKHIRIMQEKVRYLLRQGNLVVIFPEGKRSLDGKLMTQDFQYGVGDILREMPNCRVLCSYLRADKQVGRTDVPPFGSQIYITFKMMQPATSFEGLRASRDVAGQIITTLDSMEKEYFAKQAVDR